MSKSSPGRIYILACRHGTGLVLPRLIFQESVSQAVSFFLFTAFRLLFFNLSRTLIHYSICAGCTLYIFTHRCQLSHHNLLFVVRQLSCLTPPTTFQGLSAPTGNCTASTYCPTGSATPVPCAPGTFCNATGMAAPLDCPVSTYCPTANAIAPTPCLAGSYCAISGLAAVTAQCGIDTFSLAGQRACTACARTQTSALPLGSTSCVRLPVATLPIGAVPTNTNRAGRAQFFTVPLLPPICRLQVTLTMISGASATLSASSNSSMPIPEQCATVDGDPLCQV